MPPSPVVMFFVSCSEQAPSAPMVPAWRSWYVTPIACAASSRTGTSSCAATQRERVHVRGDVLEVDRHDRGRAFRDLRRDVARIEREGFVHFGEHDVGAHRDHGADCRDERECGHDDLVARTDAQRSQCYASAAVPLDTASA